MSSQFTRCGERRTTTRCGEWRLGGLGFVAATVLALSLTVAMFLIFPPGKRLAAGGGGFFRVLPYAFSRWAIRQVNRTERRPAVFYFHPWEIDPDQPRVPNASMKSKLRHYTNLAGMAGKLEHLIGDFDWGRMDMIASREASQAAELAA